MDGGWVDGWMEDSWAGWAVTHWLGQRYARSHLGTFPSPVPLHRPTCPPRRRHGIMAAAAAEHAARVTTTSTLSRCSGQQPGRPALFVSPWTPISGCIGPTPVRFGCPRSSTARRRDGGHGCALLLVVHRLPLGAGLPRRPSGLMGSPHLRAKSLFEP